VPEICICQEKAVPLHRESSDESSFFMLGLVFRRKWQNQSKSDRY